MDNPLKKFYKDNSQRSSVQLSDASKQRVKDNIFANLSTQVVVVPISLWGKISGVFLRGYVLAPLVALLFVTGTGIASANSIPGDKLYPVKRQVEKARLFITPTEEGKLNLEIDFAEKRLQELEKVRAANPVVKDEKESIKEERKDIIDERKAEVREENEDRNSKNPQRIKAREEANHAIESLRKVQQKFEEKGRDNKVREIDERLEKFQSRIEINKNSR